MDIVIRTEEVLGTRRTLNTATRATYEMEPTQTRTHGYTCLAAALVTTDQLRLPPRRASVNTTLVRDMSPSTNGAINLPP